MKQYLLLFALFFAACKEKPVPFVPVWNSFDETALLKKSAEHEVERMQFKLLQSKVKDRNEVWKAVEHQMLGFGEEEYQNLHSLIYEQNIPNIKKAIAEDKLSYKQLTQWYIYRIVKFENDKETTLNAIISINPDAVKLAEGCDKNKKEGNHSIYGIPVLLKDNINTEGMATTAGAVALQNNHTLDAHIVERLKDKGAIILGKVNLSEWAYYLCQGCPLGYSAIGGQSLNPYGRMVFETGGSSAGSGTSMAANYGAVAVGTETSGSILSPSSKNSLVGLKPTIGLLSRTGIVPISHNLDTPGPMTRSVIDNAILLSAMTGEDPGDEMTEGVNATIDYTKELDANYLKGKRLGVVKGFLEDSLYQLSVESIKAMGAKLIEFEFPEFEYEGFTTFLNADMKAAMPEYLENYADEGVPVRSVADVVDFNLQDTTINIPYGQHHFLASAAEDIGEEELKTLQDRFKKEGLNFFNQPMDELNLDAILSINNYNAGQAAMARYPCLTVPMGYEESGEPKNLTFIAKAFEEHKLLKMAFAYEQNNPKRKPPQDYKK